MGTHFQPSSGGVSIHLPSNFIHLKVLTMRPLLLVVVVLLVVVAPAVDAVPDHCATGVDPTWWYRGDGNRECSCTTSEYSDDFEGCWPPTDNKYTCNPRHGCVDPDGVEISE